MSSRVTFATSNFPTGFFLVLLLSGDFWIFFYFMFYFSHTHIHTRVLERCLFPPKQILGCCHNDASSLIVTNYSARHGRPDNNQKSGKNYRNHFSTIWLTNVLNCFMEAASDCLHKFFAEKVSIRLQGCLGSRRTNGRISARYRRRTLLVPHPPAHSWCPGDVVYLFPFQNKQTTS